MVSPNKTSSAIASAFTRSLELNDKSLVDSYTREEIEIALLELIGDMDSTYYAAMQIRRDELKEEEDYEREKTARWKRRIIVLLAGLALGIILLFLKLIFLS